jgi:predicted alpha/beta superfamily hydrolase
VIAAVYHGGERRIAEYTPTRVRRLGGGGAGLHARMVIEELLPWLRSRYRLLPPARHAGLGGSSLGALATLTLGLDSPRIFGKLAALSPSVWWDHGWILKRLARYHRTSHSRIWLDIGTQEGDKPFGSVRDVRLLKAMLVSNGWREGRSLSYLEDPGGTQSEASRAARVPRMLAFLYPRKVG